MNFVSSSTKYAWVSGVVGALTLVVCSFVDSFQEKNHALLVLLMTGGVMMVVELSLRFVVLKRAFKSIKSKFPWKQGLKDYIMTVALLQVATLVYTYAPEYGYGTGNPYYSTWLAWFFYFKKIIWIIGLPYFLFTEAFFPQDVRARKLSWEKVGPWLVKLFFIPVMSIFFVDQYTHAKSNWSFMLGPNPLGIRDVYHIGVTFIFMVDIGVAWCGYVFSSKWLDNHIRSVEPTLLGWASALLCYPPFRTVFAYYFTVPSEDAFLGMQNDILVVFFVCIALLTTLVYMVSTLCFGLRFSNLTHRGVIQSGPYALVRHPAYAAKNLFWWTSLFPMILWELGHVAAGQTLWQVVSLAALSGLYYVRAITEENHLKMDPTYVSYCQRVKFRFIPGVF